MDFLWLTVGGIGFTFFMATLGSAFVFCFKNQLSKRVNAVFLGVSSGLMLAACIWSLLLPAFEKTKNGWGRYAFIPVVGGFLLGGAFLFFTDILFNGKKNEAEKRKTKRLFLAVTLHNIPEGLAVGFAFGAAWATWESSAFLSALTLAVGIGVQNFPEGAAIALPLHALLKSRKKSFLYSLCSNAVEPLFAILGFFLAAYLRSTQPWLLAFAAGAMFFVVCEDLIPDAIASSVKKDGQFSALGVWCMLLGFCLMMVLEVVLA